jgi:HlyD family secretion protein
MRSKRLWMALAVVAAAGVLYALMGQRSGSGTSYRFVEVERGTVEQLVTSTGTMQATQTVEVGTQVSGLLSGIYVDFNDRVKKGDLLAQVDPALLQQAVRSAEASLARNTAEVEHARRNLARAMELLETKVVAATEVETAQYQADVAEASFRQAQVAVEQARRNLEYSRILAPVDGVVIERAVDVGQTVAASMSAPVLFLIAQDLSQMEILASVDESDIGLIHAGQEVRFTVQAYPEETFRGEVRQVRLQSKMVENVVTYSVAIGVDNPSGRLLPGMTATVDFVVARAENVFKISNSALRFQPTEAMRAELEAVGNRVGGQSEGVRFASLGEGSGGAAASGQPSATARLYYLDGHGKLAVVLVEKGLSDRLSTVITGPGIREGMRIIVAISTGTTSTDNAGGAASNPFQSQNGNRPPGGSPPPM